jgi:bifunctional enzyme CysN/CysC
MNNTLELLEQDKHKDLLRFVTAGSVDDGKSTLIGRLLYESKGIYEDQLEAVKKVSGKKGSTQGSMDLSLVTDGLKAEREQGITIDVAYRFFSTPKRKFIIADSPGHEQYTRNMATGASTANLAIILIDAEQGVLIQTKRHTFICSLLGIPHIVVAVNKMDLVDYAQDVYERICLEYRDFAAKLEVTDITFIPMSALEGDNVVEPSKRMIWFKGSTLLNHLESVHIASDRNLIDLRFPIQYVSRSDRTFRGYLGTVASGTIRPGDEVMVIPSGVRTQIKTVFSPDGDLDEAFPPLSIGVTVEDDVDISRGDLLVHVHNVPKSDRTLDAMVVWMNEEPMIPGKEYLIKHSTRTTPGVVSTLRFRVDVNTLHRSQQDQLKLNEIGRCLVTLSKPVAFDAYNRNRTTGSFIVIDRVSNSTVGAGMILDREPNPLVADLHKATAKPKSEHIQSSASQISAQQRAERMGGDPSTIWLTGLVGSGKTTLAYALEKRLFDLGRNAYVIDGGNARQGFSRDLGFNADDRRENIRRAAEFARMLNDAGVTAICAFLSPSQEDRQLARKITGKTCFHEIYLSAPVDVCKQRDTTGIYKLAESGEIAHLSGVSAPYEIPKTPGLIVPTYELSVADSIELIISNLKLHA